jgi:hypothetical protein
LFQSFFLNKKKDKTNPHLAIFAPVRCARTPARIVRVAGYTERAVYARIGRARVLSCLTHGTLVVRCAGASERAAGAHALPVIETRISG